MANTSLGLDRKLSNDLLQYGLREHPLQTALREATLAHPNARMQISPEQAQHMAQLVRAIGPVAP